MSHRILFATIRPHLVRYLMEISETDEEGHDPYGKGVIALAARAGLHPDSISKPLQGARETISFSSADKILCAAGLTMLWHTDPILAEAYWPQGRPADPFKPVKCKNPNCGEWFELLERPCDGAVGGTRYSKRAYCDVNCKARAAHARNPKARSRAVKKNRRKSREAYNTYMRNYRAQKKAEFAEMVAAL